MVLLIIAHTGEASEFMRRKHTLAVDFYFNGLYRSEDELLLISGGGTTQTAEKLDKVCRYFGNKIGAVVNLGIAGALHKTLEINQIYGIREVIHESLPLRFRSFDSRSKYNCITAASEVLSDSKAGIFSRQAHIVDRELWAVAAVCDQLQYPFRAYKLISDFAGAQTDTGKIKSNASFFSKHLFDFYTKLKISKSALINK